MDTRSTSASSFHKLVRTSTTTTSPTATAIWIRIHYTATVPFFKPSVVVSPLAIFFCVILRRTSAHFMPFSPLAHFLMLLSRLRICRTLLHCMNVTSARSMTFFNHFFCCALAHLLLNLGCYVIIAYMLSRTLERSFHLYCGIVYYPTTKIISPKLTSKFRYTLLNYIMSCEFSLHALPPQKLNTFGT